MAKIKSRVEVTVVTVKSPSGMRDYGQRFLAALPNEAGRTPRGDVCTSFKSPYLVYEGMVSDPADMARHKANIASMGFYS